MPIGCSARSSGCTVTRSLPAPASGSRRSTASWRAMVVGSGSKHHLMPVRCSSSPSRPHEAMILSQGMWSPDGQQDAGLVPGTMVGEYCVERLVGEGGMGQVYGAVHPV